MGIVSAFTIIRSLSIFHITLAYFFLTSPKTIADQNVVFLLGEAMRLETPLSFSNPSAPLAFLALILAFLGISDLTAVSMADEYARVYWMAQVPVRLSLLFLITGYTYTFKEGGIFARASGHYKMNAGDNLKNAVVFAFGFLELSLWFWVFVSLRDERRQKAYELIEKRKRQAEMYGERDI